jgi:hypothetical protein
MRWISFSAAILFCGLACAADEPSEWAHQPPPLCRTFAA